MSVKNLCLFLIFIAFTLSSANHTREIPSFLKICHCSDPQLNECVRNSVELLRNKLASGIPDMGVPALEPLIIPEVSLDQGSGVIRMKSTYTNIHVRGPSRFRLKSVRVEPDKDRIKIRLWFPVLQLNGLYSMQGRILMMPIAGQGNCRGNYTDVDAAVTIYGERIPKNGEEYFNVKEISVNFKIRNASIHLDNLFGSDKDLGNAMNVFLNENWKSVANGIKPLLEDKIAELVKMYSNKIFHKYPLNILLPP